MFQNKVVEKMKHILCLIVVIIIIIIIIIIIFLNLKITDILNNFLDHKKTFKKTRIKLYNKLALPVLLYGS